jgi:cytochrome c-type biogenesis protein CcmE
MGSGESAESPPTPVPVERRRGIRPRYAIVALLCIGAIVWMITLMQRNVVFFKTVSDAVADRESDGTRSMRIGGAVVPASIEQTPEGVRFELTEGGVVVHVDHVGSEPGLFKDCAPVVAEGHWDRETFASTRLLIKHGNDYKPPPDAEARCPEDPFRQ